MTATAAPRGVRRRGWRAGVLLLPALGLFLLSACREEEQGRSFTLEKGSYQGAADEALNDQQLEALRLRALQQKS